MTEILKVHAACQKYNKLDPLGVPVDFRIYAHDREFWEDSEVYRVKMDDGLDLAYKVFHKKPVMKIDQLQLYKEITNLASQLDLNEGGWFDEEVDIRVNPILSVGREYHNNYPVTVSNFIVGPQLSYLYRELGEPLTKDPITHLPVKLPSGLSMSVGLKAISQVLNRNCGTKGIDLDPGNVKVVFTNSGVSFVITDLCKQIRSLRNV